jgi:N utilization substance protein B
MATRRHAREWALQMLFQLDHNPAPDLERALAEFWRQQEAARADEVEERGRGAAPRPEEGSLAPERVRAFAERLVRGVAQNREAIDARLAGYVRNWSLGRLGGVERNVMRLAFYELFFETETPPVVCINEAVDLAKYFSNAEAGRFVNGILDRAAKDARKPA